jgi:hypothetical protein
VNLGWESEAFFSVSQAAPFLNLGPFPNLPNISFRCPLFQSSNFRAKAMFSPRKIVALLATVAAVLLLEDDICIERNSRRSVKRKCLHEPDASAWWMLDANGDDDAFITFTGLDRKTFDDVYLKFKPIFDM